MVDQLRRIALVEPLDALPLVYPVHHVREHQFLFGRVHQSVSGDQHLQRVQQRGRDRRRADRVEDQPHHRRACEEPDHFEALKLDGRVQCLADEVDPGRLVEAHEALLALHISQGLEERCVLIFGSVHLR